MRVYLDHNATAPLRPGVKAAMAAAWDVAGNPSSVHAEGRAARKIIDDAREALAFSLGCLPQMLVFTASGTEANSLALHGPGAERLVVSAIEHASVLETARAQGLPVNIVPVDSNGVIDLAALDSAISGPNVLVSVMLANNETGVVQPIADVVRIARAKGALVHVDAVQAYGRIPVNFGLLGCDLMTVAAHKAGGPKGVGALIVRDGLALAPLLRGGGQELRRRAGTENVPAIAGFGALATEEPIATEHLRNRLEAELAGAVVFGSAATRLPNTSCLAVPGLKAESLLMNLDLAGFAVSTGSACSSGKVARSHVLDAMGVSPELASCAIRISLGWNTTPADIDAFISTFRNLVARHRARVAA